MKVLWNKEVDFIFFDNEEWVMEYVEIIIDGFEEIMDFIKILFVVYKCVVKD